MKTVQKVVVLLGLLIPQYIFCDVIIGIDAPESLVNVLQQIDQKIKEKINAYNAKNGTTFMYDPSIAYYPFHLSLSYVSDRKEKLSDYFTRLGNVKTKKLLYSLNTIAQNSSPIDISKNLAHAHFDFWKGAQGKKARKGGSNFYNIVVKLEESPDLKKLSQEINSALGIKPHFPFSAHFLVGQLFEKDNNENVHMFVETLKKDLSSVGDMLPDVKNVRLMVEEFDLKGDDPKDKEEDKDMYFELKGKKQPSSRIPQSKTALLYRTP